MYTYVYILIYIRYIWNSILSNVLMMIIMRCPVFEATKCRHPEIQLALETLDYRRSVGLPRHVGREERKWTKIASCLTLTLCGKSWASAAKKAGKEQREPNSPDHMFSIGLAKKYFKKNHQVVKTLPGFRKQCDRFDVSIGQKHIAVSRSEDQVVPWELGFK